jgi:hypothetical protein
LKKVLIEESCNEDQTPIYNWIPHYYPLILFHADCWSTHNSNWSKCCCWVIDWNLVWLITLIYRNYGGAWWKHEVRRYLASDILIHCVFSFTVQLLND